MSLILFSNILVTAFLVGLIWFVQIVHYPIFKEVGKQNFHQFHVAHTVSTGKIVILPMLLELGLSFWLVWEEQSFFSIIALLITILLWILTAWIFVPLHGKLGDKAKGYDLEIMKKLVFRNWFRTLFWSLRLIILSYMLIQMTSNL
ncbi:MAG: hypothetical protein COZ18_04750 [Flexibacter sp. CG_4_10_14_3_um_filter_32_15]|nr:MAG: hypothetical protein COZ18_04750 [Flexibacter sp. CG_4_10_14_3_um_filter_32_15]